MKERVVEIFKARRLVRWLAVRKAKVKVKVASIVGNRTILPESVPSWARVKESRLVKELFQGLTRRAWARVGFRVPRGLGRVREENWPRVGGKVCPTKVWSTPVPKDGGTKELVGYADISGIRLRNVGWFDRWKEIMRKEIMEERRL